MLICYFNILYVDFVLQYWLVSSRAILHVVSFGIRDLEIGVLVCPYMSVHSLFLVVYIDDVCTCTENLSWLACRKCVH